MPELMELSEQEWDAFRQGILEEFGEDIDELVTFENALGQTVSFKRFRLAAKGHITDTAPASRQASRGMPSNPPGSPTDF